MIGPYLAKQTSSVNSELLPVFAPACVNTTIKSLNKPLVVVVVVVVVFPPA